MKLRTKPATDSKTSSRYTLRFAAPDNDATRNSLADNSPDADRVEPARWGKDHWSVFAYVETCVVDQNGLLDRRRVQANLNRHPHFAGGLASGSQIDGAAYPIRLRNGETLPGPDYDEWDCIDDLELHGLVENIGTGLNRCYRLTFLGENLAGQVRAHKGRGKGFGTFEPVWPPPALTSPAATKGPSPCTPLV